jgi:hypothetical protein
VSSRLRKTNTPSFFAPSNGGITDERSLGPAVDQRCLVDLLGGEPGVPSASPATSKATSTATPNRVVFPNNCSSQMVTNAPTESCISTVMATSGQCGSSGLTRKKLTRESARPRIPARLLRRRRGVRETYEFDLRLSAQRMAGRERKCPLSTARKRRRIQGPEGPLMGFDSSITEPLPPSDKN